MSTRAKNPATMPSQRQLRRLRKTIKDAFDAWEGWRGSLHPDEWDEFDEETAAARRDVLKTIGQLIKFAKEQSKR